MTPPLVLLESYAAARDPDSFAFLDPCGEMVARTPGEVLPALRELARATAGGLHSAGYLGYEAASGLDPVLRTRAAAADLPLLWFGLFRHRQAVAPGSLRATGPYTLTDWQPTVTRPDFDAAIGRVRRYIAAGDTYQVNYTFRMRARLEGDDRALYRDLCRSQRASYCAYLDLGRYRLLSASPELFLSLRDGVLTSRPMKGTRPRGRWPAEDDDLAAALVGSPKDRAENVMIVDLLRNDLGRVSAVGSVGVPRLWEVERYETVLQMTSTVTSRLRPGVGLVELMQALFPCGSITGAPKVRTMEIIAELESSPRGVYTGAIGCISPGPECRFSVAIRTAVLDTADGALEFGVGGGITWDSSAAGEYEECLVKARLLRERRPDFDLLETMLHEPGAGYFLLERHLERLASSARYFG
ncbi:MAG: aminodeoxychorismate synthase component I, partial [Gemmatimonadota bacterium]